MRSALRQYKLLNRVAALVGVEQVTMAVAKTQQAPQPAGLFHRQEMIQFRHLTEASAGKPHKLGDAGEVDSGTGTGEALLAVELKSNVAVPGNAQARNPPHVYAVGLGNDFH